MGDLDDPAEVKRLRWTNDRSLDTKSIGGKPWRMKHGDIIVFKDSDLKNVSNQTKSWLSVAEHARLFNATVGTANSKSGVITSQRREVGIKIYTPQEQRQRAKEKKEKEEKEKKEKEEKEEKEKEEKEKEKNQDKGKDDSSEVVKTTETTEKET